ncbi:MAG: DUF3224 domain-containing protein [Gemmatimonadales bacterium]
MTTKTARGTFDVKLAALPIEVGPTVGRRSIAKTFAGDLTGSGVGQMISALGGVEGSAGYVAMELVTGTLDGRRGSFILQHSSTMARGAPTQSITVVPDSGTGELAGLRGSMEIVIEGGKHSYVFQYSLPK